MSNGFSWAPKKVQLRVKVALRVAVVRLWVGLIFLLSGAAFAYVNLQPPTRPTNIKTALLAGQEKSSTRRTASASRTADGRLDGSAIVVSSLGGQTLNDGDRVVDRLSGPDLVRAVQEELRRVGCYSGAIDGRWGPRSRAAISSFLERANAMLQAEKPDYAHLRLLRTFEGRACGTCPVGQTYRNGRCIPSDMLAYQPLTGESEDFRPRPAPLPGRMSVGAHVGGSESEPRVRTYRRSESRRVVERSSGGSRSSGSSGRRHWTETIFDNIANR
jgi:hypothetical protein